MKITIVILSLFAAFPAFTQSDLIQVKDGNDSIHTTIDGKTISVSHKDIAADYLFRGMEAGNNQEFEIAKELFTTALLYDVENPDIYFNLGLAEFHLGNKEISIARYSKAIELDTTNADAVSQRGVAYAHLGMYEQSEQDFIKLAAYPDHAAKGFNQLGILYLQQSEFEKACNMFQKALELEYPGATALLDKYCN